ncbi:MAG TPA: hypothetical protein VFD33_06265 [Bacillota bacterium]|nr:hypothetical protein [Bacillota bacterium]
MEKFKSLIKRKIILFTLLLLMAIALGGYTLITGGKGIGDESVQGFQSGIALGIAIMALIQIATYCIALKDDKKLKLLCNKENDERMEEIRKRSGMPMLLVMSMLMLLAAVIAGYFNTLVFTTLVLTAIIQLTIGLIVKLYHMKTM